MADIETAYNFFLEKYKKSLFAPYSKISNKTARMQAYLDLITQNIFNSRKNVTVTDTESNIKDLISKCLHFKKTKDAFENKITVLKYHGSPAKKNPQIVPDNCVICFLTPLSYIHQNTNAQYSSFVHFLLQPTTPALFKNNPFCLYAEYLKKSKLLPKQDFSNYKVFFSGQLYCDIKLYEDTENINKMGVYYTKHADSRNKLDTLSKQKNNNITEEGILLSDLLKAKKYNGIIFIKACRDLDLNSKNNNSDILAKRYEYTKKYIIYEHMLNILNRCSWYFNNQDQYYECIYFNKYFNEYESSQIKSYTNNNMKNRVSPQIRTLRRFNNRSVGSKLPTGIAKLGISEDLAAILYDNILNFSKIKNEPRFLRNIFEQLDNILFNKAKPYNKELKLQLLNSTFNINDLNIDFTNIVTDNNAIQEYVFVSHLLASFTLYKLITSYTTYAPEYIFFEKFWKRINQNNLNIYLSHCNLNLEQFNKLFKFLTKKYTYYLLINGNHLYDLNYTNNTNNNNNVNTNANANVTATANATANVNDSENANANDNININNASNITKLFKNPIKYIKNNDHEDYNSFKKKFATHNNTILLSKIKSKLKSIKHL